MSIRVARSESGDVTDVEFAARDSTFVVCLPTGPLSLFVVVCGNRDRIRFDPPDESQNQKALIVSSATTAPMTPATSIDDSAARAGFGVLIPNVDDQRNDGVTEARNVLNRSRHDLRTLEFEDDAAEALLSSDTVALSETLDAVRSIVGGVRLRELPDGDVVSSCLSSSIEPFNQSLVAAAYQIRNKPITCSKVACTPRSDRLQASRQSVKQVNFIRLTRNRDLHGTSVTQNHRNCIRNAKLRQRQGRNFNATRSRSAQKCARAASREMQHCIDAADPKSVRHVIRETRHWNHAIGGVGDHRETALTKLSGEVARKIGTCEVT